MTKKHTIYKALSEAIYLNISLAYYDCALRIYVILNIADIKQRERVKGTYTTWRILFNLKLAIKIECGYILGLIRQCILANSLFEEVCLPF